MGRVGRIKPGPMHNLGIGGPVNYHGGNLDGLLGPSFLAHEKGDKNLGVCHAGLGRQNLEAHNREALE